MRACRRGSTPRRPRTSIAEFNKLLKTSPEEAAEVIVQGIIKRRGRVLIGGDARMLDRIQRLFPETYWKRIARREPNIANGGARGS